MTLYEIVCNDTTPTEITFPAGRNFLIAPPGDVHWNTTSSVTLSNPVMSQLGTVLDLAAESSVWCLTQSGNVTVKFLNYPKAC
jgi:hypothetical protein